MNLLWMSEISQPWINCFAVATKQQFCSRLLGLKSNLWKRGTWMMDWQTKLPCMKYYSWWTQSGEQILEMSLEENKNLICISIFWKIFPTDFIDWILCKADIQHYHIAISSCGLEQVQMTPWCNHLRVSLYLMSQHVKRSLSIVSHLCWDSMDCNSMNQKKENTLVKKLKHCHFSWELSRYWHFWSVNALSWSFSHTVGMGI